MPRSARPRLQMCMNASAPAKHKKQQKDVSYQLVAYAGKAQ